MAQNRRRRNCFCRLKKFVFSNFLGCKIWENTDHAGIQTRFLSIRFLKLGYDIFFRKFGKKTQGVMDELRAPVVGLLNFSKTRPKI